MSETTQRRASHLARACSARGELTADSLEPPVFANDLARTVSVMRRAVLRTSPPGTTALAW